jgi:DNA helicase II / ATP-dependent DNA helicase PcrA
MVNPPIENLNQEQKRAVQHRSGPLLIIAGAGTGKTKVITHRIAYLLKKKLAQPEEILALTFTDKAAEEMEQRVDILLPYGLIDTWVSTFHAFGDRVLREEAILAGLSPEFRVLTKTEQVLFFREHLFDFKLKLLRPITNPTKNIEALIEIISRAKDENIGPKEYQRYSQELAQKASSKEKRQEARLQQEIARTYQTYEKLKREHNFLDFADQIYQTYQLFQNHPQLLKKYRKKFKYILVDEFQDTNYLQNELVKLLAQPQQNLTAVGDDDQSIYKFRGASISNIMDFKKDFPQAKQIILTKNYRSSQKILDSAYRLIKFNNPDRLEKKSKIDKKLISQVKQGPQPQVAIFDQIQNEADFIAEKIVKLTKDKKFRYRDVAILIRGNSYAEPFIQALNSKGIPWIFSGQSGLYQEQEVQLLTAFLRTIASNRDSLSLYRLAESSTYQLPADDLIECLDQSRKTKQSLFWVMKRAGQNKSLNLSGAGLKIIEQLVADIGQYRQVAKKESAGQVLYQFLKDKQVLERLTKRATTKAETQIKNIADFFNRIKEFERIINRGDLQHLVEYLDSIIEAGDNPEIQEFDPDFNAVNLLTVHAAKGLEFEAVFLASLTSDRFPSFRRGKSLELPEKFIKETLPQGDFHLQEERRLFYVGMTRAKRQLFLSMSYNCGGQRKKRPSPFITEALGKQVLKEIEQKKNSQLEQIELFGQSQLEPTKPSKSAYQKLYFTPYKIDDYRTCPLKYKYVNILKLPVIRKFEIAFGSTLHNTIQVFLQNKKEGRDLSLKELLPIFKKFWQNEGFFNRDHQQDTKRKAEKILANFIKEESSRPAPNSIEESFSIQFKDNIIRGRWDAAYQTGGKIDLVDFKSSDLPDPQKAQQRVQKSIQLDIYAWGFLKKTGKLPDRVGLYFLSSDNQAYKQPTEKTIIKIKEMVTEVGQGIREENFDPKPSQWNCRYCAYNQICPYAQR